MMKEEPNSNIGAIISVKDKVKELFSEIVNFHEHSVGSADLFLLFFFFNVDFNAPLILEKAYEIIKREIILDNKMSINLDKLWPPETLDNSL